MIRLTVIATVCVPLVLRAGECDVIDSLRKESRSHTYLPPERSELKIAQKLFEHLLRGERNLARVIPLCRELELDLVLVENNGEGFVVLTEIEGARRGRGLYVFRRSRSSPVMLQAPHAFHDLHTGSIAERLFLETDIAVGAWNTASRTVTVQGGAARADLAHRDTSYLQVLTAAFARVYPEGLALQVHGFSKEKRSTVEAALSDMIVSNGTPSAGRTLGNLASCLSEQLSLTVAVYPRDVAELGGTTNVQSKLLRSLGHDGFLHLELSLEARRRLLGSERDRRRFWRCFRESLR